PGSSTKSSQVNARAPAPRTPPATAWPPSPLPVSWPARGGTPPHVPPAAPRPPPVVASSRHRARGIPHTVGPPRGGERIEPCRTTESGGSMGHDGSRASRGSPGTRRTLTPSSPDEHAKAVRSGLATVFRQQKVDDLAWTGHESVAVAGQQDGSLQVRFGQQEIAVPREREAGQRLDRTVGDGDRLLETVGPGPAHQS